MKRLTSIVMALALSAVMCVSAFAKDVTTVRERTYNLGDGVTATIVVEKDADRMMAREGLNFSSTASPKATQNYNFKSSDGANCSVFVWNDASRSSGTTMSVKFVINVNGKTTTLSDVVDPGDRATTKISSSTGAGLTGSIKTTIQAVNANSVPYTFLLDQY